MATYAQKVARGFKFFNLTISNMSEEGLENFDGIMLLVFQYFNMLRQEKPHKWIFDEINEMGITEFE